MILVRITYGEDKEVMLTSADPRFTKEFGVYTTSKKYLLYAMTNINKWCRVNLNEEVQFTIYS